VARQKMAAFCANQPMPISETWPLNSHGNSCDVKNWRFLDNNLCDISDSVYL